MFGPQNACIFTQFLRRVCCVLPRDIWHIRQVSASQEIVNRQQHSIELALWRAIFLTAGPTSHHNLGCSPQNANRPIGAEPAGVRSLGSSATIEAPTESPTKRMAPVGTQTARQIVTSSTGSRLSRCPRIPSCTMVRRCGLRERRRRREPSARFTTARDTKVASSLRPDSFF
jgi:hypothetical protein